MNPRFWPAYLASLAIPALGCNDVSWPSMRNVTTLRILAVKAEPPSLLPRRDPLLPGQDTPLLPRQSTHLSLLCENGASAQSSNAADGGTSDPTCKFDRSSIEVAWFAGCDNPENNDPLKCLDRINAASSQLQPIVFDTPASDQFAVGATFDFVPPANLDRNQVTLSGQTVNYGVSYVYFVACAGELHHVEGVTDRLPVECRGRDTNAVLDQTHYVAGYTTIYTYDKVQNANPALDGVRVDCDVPGKVCDGKPCCTTDNPASVQRCDPSHPETCRSHCIDFQVSSDSFHLTRLDGSRVESPLKSLWAQYYTNAGHVPDDADAQFGLAAPPPSTLPTSDSVARSPCAAWQAPTSAKDDARVWIVVRDDRGGLNWIEQRFNVY